MLQLLEALRDINLGCRIIVGGQLQFGEELRDFHRDRCHGLTQSMLVQDVTRDGEQIRLGTADGLVMLDAHETQEHLLRQIRCIRDIAQPLRQEASQAIAVAAGNGGDEAVAQAF